MEIQYLLDGKICSTTESNDDLLISLKEEKKHFGVSLKAKKDIVLKRVVSQIEFHHHKDNLYYLNGYQGWSRTLEASIKTKEKDAMNFPKFLLEKFPIQRYGDYEFYEYKRNKLHSYDIFYVISKEENIGILNNIPKEVTLIVEINKKDKAHLNLIADVEYIHLKKDEERVIYDYEVFENKEETLKAFNNKYPIININKIYGYTSWYNYYQDINEEIMLRDLEGLDSKFNLFQIDDGYETFVGDWLDVDEKKFPHGLKPIIDKIHSKNLKAGLWLAPFVAEENSKLFKEHPEYFKLDKDNKPIKVGVNWSGQYVLDIEKKEVRDYIQKCLEHYMDLGIDFFKLDFLYAINCGELKKSRTETSEEGYKFLRSVLSDKLILGCGALPFNSYKNFDYLRIGPDMTLDWDDKPLMRLLHGERPSTKHTTRNTIYRQIFDKRLFGCDPDVFLLRDINIKLTFEQRRALATVDALCGSVFMNSDDMVLYSKEAKETLEKVHDLFMNAKDVKQTTNKKYIHIEYTLNNEHHSFDYNKKKGVLENER